MFQRVTFCLLCSLFWVGIGCDKKERVIGDHGTQPKTEVIFLSEKETSEVRPIIGSAQRAIQDFNQIWWPEPAKIVEHEQQWDVVFQYREKIVEQNGSQSIRAQDPSSLLIVVQKSDLSAQVIPGR